MNDDAREEVVEVSREAIAALAAQAAGGVEGVAACQLKGVDSIASRVKREFIHQGVKVERNDDSYALSVYLRVIYGVDLPRLTQEVRKKVKDYVEGLTQVKVEEIEVVIEDVEPPDE
ncbi:MAG: Asp23/Gls24 family envelope stress response protein [Actinomycetota bacterium]|nr:Asp23/Gls24 family envelope stress response protein [Actinomycetota bacterium]